MVVTMDLVSIRGWIRKCSYGMNYFVNNSLLRNKIFGISIMYQSSIWAPLVAAAVGGSLAIAGVVVAEWMKNKNRRKAIAFAFSGEIKGLLQINEVRGYMRRLCDVINKLKNGSRSEHLYGFSVNEGNYFLVYKRNVEHIGILPADISKSITLGYSLIFSFLEDVKSWRSSNRGAADQDVLSTLIETQKIFEEAISELESAANLIENKKCWWF